MIGNMLRTVESAYTLMLPPDWANTRQQYDWHFRKDIAFDTSAR